MIDYFFKSESSNLECLVFLSKYFCICICLCSLNYTIIIYKEHLSEYWNDWHINASNKYFNKSKSFVSHKSNILSNNKWFFLHILNIVHYIFNFILYLKYIVAFRFFLLLFIIIIISINARIFIMHTINVYPQKEANKFIIQSNTYVHSVGILSVLYEGRRNLSFFLQVGDLFNFDEETKDWNIGVTSRIERPCLRTIGIIIKEKDNLLD